MTPSKLPSQLKLRHSGNRAVNLLEQCFDVSPEEWDFSAWQSVDDLPREDRPRIQAILAELAFWQRIVCPDQAKKLPDELLIRAKKDGFADGYLAMLLETEEKTIREQRLALGLSGAWECVPVSGVENAAYYFSTYNGQGQVKPGSKEKVMILGGGPNRIGQGIEFDYCCVHAAFALRDLGYETIIVNCNPETVSTDYDTSDRLYFEPLTVEDVLNIYHQEKPLGVIVQFGGQTPLNIAGDLAAAGVRILGTALEAIDWAEDRDHFAAMMQKLNIPMPKAGMAGNLEEALRIAEEIGYPVMVRPSYVLGGRGMECVHDEEMLRQYVAAAVKVTPDRPILIDKFLDHAIEAEADAISDGKNVFVPAVMEHIEYAGVHSGDSACVIPPINIADEHLRTIYEYTKKIARELQVVGLMNIQYAIADGRVYVLEANPRASRTVPLVSKVCNVSMARLATEIIMGKTRISHLKTKWIPHFGVKEAVLPFNMFHEVDPVLGPEMRSTGEVLGIAESFGVAFFKAQESTQAPLPCTGTVLISVRPEDRPDVLEVAQRFDKLGFKILATEGTNRFLNQHGIHSTYIKKLYEGRPNILDSIANHEIDLVINTPVGRIGEKDDSYIRKAAIKYKIPYITTLTAALASAKGIEAYLQLQKDNIKSLQEYHAEITESE